MSTVAVIGSGSWGVAFSQHLAEMGYKVKVWSFKEEEKDDLNNNRKSIYLPDLTIHENVYCSNDFKEVVEDAEFIIHVTPSRVTRETFKQYKDYVGNKPVVICSKGFEEGTLLTLDEVMKQELPGVRVATLSGPSYATEVAAHIPTAVILASEDTELLEEISAKISNEIFRVYKSTDVKGVEVGGGLKNIIAFSAGIAAELDFGMNAQAALITRGLAEISRLGIAMGADKQTFYGLSGLGDLILTCSSDESRNRRAGRLIGRGLSVEEAKKEIGMTIESIDNIVIAKKLAEKYNIEMPITNTAYDMLFNGLPVKEAVNQLMTRNLKYED